MHPVLTAAAMREADRLTIEDYGLPGFTLMETAGRAAVDRIARRYGPLAGKTVTCLCGKGNNGGDGLVVARVLLTHGARLQVVTLAGAEALSPDAALNLRLLQALARHDEAAAVRLHVLDTPDDLDTLAPSDLLVDALLGTGLTSAPREPIRSCVAWLNRHPAPTVALDIPTGLHTDHGTVLGEAVRADLTVTMGALKTGLLVGDGPDHAGRAEAVEIGIPAFLLDRMGREPGCARRPTDADVAGWLPRRPAVTHKYDVGMALVVAGSPGLTGAAVMAATSAARSGAGAVVCATAAPVQAVLAAHMTTVMAHGLPADDEGFQPEAALDALDPHLRKARALLVGCGLGRQPGTQAFVRTLLERADQPLVVDADGLNALAGHVDLIRRHAQGRWILTPHLGEFRRLAGDDVDLTDRIEVARTYAKHWNCVLILKGLPSLVGTPDGDVYINATGNAALATAGTGDVLAGTCAGLLAQGLSPEHAAVCALHVGGLAADRYADHYAAGTMLATDLPDIYPDVFRTLLTPTV